MKDREEGFYLFNKVGADVYKDQGVKCLNAEEYDHEKIQINFQDQANKTESSTYIKIYQKGTFSDPLEDR